jgi:hypothetical protein
MGSRRRRRKNASLEAPPIAACRSASVQAREPSFAWREGLLDTPNGTLAHRSRPVQSRRRLNMKSAKIAVFTLLASASALAVALFPRDAAAGSDVKFEELPAAVQTTVKREVKTGKITDIEKDTDQGKLLYEIEFDVAGKSWEIDVAPDGTLIRRHED